MLDSFDEFKTAILTVLQDKIAERIANERKNISNDLFSDEINNNVVVEPQSNIQ